MCFLLRFWGQYLCQYLYIYIYLFIETYSNVCCELSHKMSWMSKGSPQWYPHNNESLYEAPKRLHKGSRTSEDSAYYLLVGGLPWLGGTNSWEMCFFFCFLRFYPDLWYLVQLKSCSFCLNHFIDDA